VLRGQDAVIDEEQKSEDPALMAEELMEAAAYSKDGEGRLWRLEWAQAFRRLAELGRGKSEHGET
jgi:hypothetical protein